MGHTVSAKCLDCGKRFTVDHGGGFFFHLVRCDTCGKTKSIGFDDVDDPLQEDPPIDPTARDEYYRGIEAFAGKCRCGGTYTFDAPPRCPKCGSMHIKEGEPTVMYD